MPPTSKGDADRLGQFQQHLEALSAEELVNIYSRDDLMGMFDEGDSRLPAIIAKMGRAADDLYDNTMASYRTAKLETPAKSMKELAEKIQAKIDQGTPVSPTERTFLSQYRNLTELQDRVSITNSSRTKTGTHILDLREAVDQKQEAKQRAKAAAEEARKRAEEEEERRREQEAEAARAVTPGRGTQPRRTPMAGGVGSTSRATVPSATEPAAPRSKTFPPQYPPVGAPVTPRPIEAQGTPGEEAGEKRRTKTEQRIAPSRIEKERAELEAMSIDALMTAGRSAVASLGGIDNHDNWNRESDEYRRWRVINNVICDKVEKETQHSDRMELESYSLYLMEARSYLNRELEFYGDQIEYTATATGTEDEVEKIDEILDDIEARTPTPQPETPPAEPEAPVPQPEAPAAPGSEAPPTPPEAPPTPEITEAEFAGMNAEQLAKQATEEREDMDDEAGNDQEQWDRFSGMYKRWRVIGEILPKRIDEELGFGTVGQNLSLYIACLLDYKYRLVTEQTLAEKNQAPQKEIARIRSSHDAILTTLDRLEVMQREAEAAAAPATPTQPVAQPPEAAPAPVEPPATPEMTQRLEQEKHLREIMAAWDALKILRNNINGLPLPTGFFGGNKELEFDSEPPVDFDLSKAFDGMLIKGVIDLATMKRKGMASQAQLIEGYIAAYEAYGEMIRRYFGGAAKQEITPTAPPTYLQGAGSWLRKHPRITGALAGLGLLAGGAYGVSQLSTPEAPTRPGIAGTATPGEKGEEPAKKPAEAPKRPEITARVKVTVTEKEPEQKRLESYNLKVNLGGSPWAAMQSFLKNPAVRDRFMAALNTTPQFAGDRKDCSGYAAPDKDKYMYNKGIVHVIEAMGDYGMIRPNNYFVLEETGDGFFILRYVKAADFAAEQAAGGVAVAAPGTEAPAAAAVGTEGGTPGPVAAGPTIEPPVPHPLPGITAEPGSEEAWEEIFEEVSVKRPARATTPTPPKPGTQDWRKVLDEQKKGIIKPRKPAIEPIRTNKPEIAPPPPKPKITKPFIRGPLPEPHKEIAEEAAKWDILTLKDLPPREQLRQVEQSIVGMLRRIQYNLDGSSRYPEIKIEKIDGLYTMPEKRTTNRQVLERMIRDNGLASELTALRERVRTYNLLKEVNKPKE